jgi:hypothetical protein
VSRGIHNEELYALYPSPNIVRMIKSRRTGWVGRMTCMGNRTGGYRGLVGRPDGTRPLGRQRRRLDDNIKMYLQEVGWTSMDLIDLAEDRERWWAVVNAVTNPRVP